LRAYVYLVVGGMYLTRRLLTYPLPDGRWLLINTLSGAIDIIAPAVAEALKQLLQNERVSLDPAIETRLRERGYLFDNPAHEDRRFQELFSTMMERRKREPVQFAICPTYSCNLRCTYCFEGDLTAGPLRAMSPEQVRNAFVAIETIRRERHPGANAHLILFGGEPLMRPVKPCVALILQEAELRGFGVGVVTNGVQIEDFLDLLLPKKRLIRQIQVTIDGPQEVHDRRRPFKSGRGSFSRIVRNVEVLLQEGLPITIRINVDRENISSLPNLMAYLEDCGWTLYPNFSCYIFPVTAYTDSNQTGILAEDEVLSELQRMFGGVGGQMPGFALYGFKVLGHVASVLNPSSLPLRMPPLFTYCEANGLRYFAFGPDGLIYPCGQGVGRQPLAIGRFHPVFELWEDRCALWERRSVLTVPQCQSCPLATLCGGGCAFGAWVRTGSLMEPNCQGSPQVLDRYIDRMISHIMHLAPM